MSMDFVLKIMNFLYIIRQMRFNGVCLVFIIVFGFVIGFDLVLFLCFFLFV